jgi:hypothetical protein
VPGSDARWPFRPPRLRGLPDRRRRSLVSLFTLGGDIQIVMAQREAATPRGCAFTATSMDRISDPATPFSYGRDVETPGSCRRLRLSTRATASWTMTEGASRATAAGWRKDVKLVALVATHIHGAGQRSTCERLVRTARIPLPPPSVQTDDLNHACRVTSKCPTRSFVDHGLVDLAFTGMTCSTRQGTFNLPNFVDEDCIRDCGSESIRRISGDVGKFAPGDKPGRELLAIKRSTQQMSFQCEVLPDRSSTGRPACTSGRESLACTARAPA